MIFVCQSSFSMHPQSVKDGTGSQDSTVILTGPGNVKHRKEKHSTSIQWQASPDSEAKERYPT